MTKPSNSSKAANTSAKDFPAVGAGYREIGIAAVAAAVRCQHMAGTDDKRSVGHAHDPARNDRRR